MDKVKSLFRKPIFISLIFVFSTTPAFAGPATEAALLLAFYIIRHISADECFEDMDSECNFAQEIRIAKGSNKIIGDRNCHVDFAQPLAFPESITCYPVSCTTRIVTSADQSGIMGTSKGDYCILSNGDILIKENGSIDGGLKKFQDARGVFGINAAREAAVMGGGNYFGV